MDSLHIAATGMRAHQAQVDSIANNVSNVNTVGYKRETISFATVVSQLAAQGVELPEALAELARGRGYGAVTQTQLSMLPGELRKTGEALNLAIDGAGFLEVRRVDGTPAFTRSLQLKVDAEGRLTAAGSDAALAADIVLPPDTLELRIESDGRVRAVLDAQGNTAELGQLNLVTFANPAALEAVGGNLFAATAASGEVREGRPGEEGRGSLRQGYLESSNVQLVDELVALLLAQRAFEMNSRVAQAADQMLSITNNLYRP